VVSSDGLCPVHPPLEITKQPRHEPNIFDCVCCRSEHVRQTFTVRIRVSSSTRDKALNSKSIKLFSDNISAENLLKSTIYGI
jgi:hypothetical protein